MEKKETLLEKIFSKDQINKGRAREMDLGRAILIVSLAFVHCTIECTPEEDLAYGMAFVWDSVIGGVFGASMFMFVMGLGMVYTRHNSIKDFVKRGLNLIALGYALNIARVGIPFLIGYQISGDKEHFIEPLIYHILSNDILIFAGLAFLAMALFRALKMSNLMMAIAALLMQLLCQLVNGIDLGSPLLNIFVGYFVGTEDAAGMVLSDFPLCHWLIIPVSGYIFAQIFVKVKNLNLFYLTFSPIFIIFSAGEVIHGINNEIGMFGEGQNCYYHISFHDVIVCMASVFALIAIYYFIMKILPGFVKKLIYRISDDITEVYFIHWIFASSITRVYLYIKNGTQILPFNQTMILAGCIFLVSFGLAELLNRVIKPKMFKEKKHEKECIS